MTEAERKQLEITACKVRMGVIEGVYNAKSGHPGGSLSASDLFTYLYFKEMNVNPEDPHMDSRDRFVLSKGHTAPGLYATLALKGFFPVEELKTLRHIGSRLQGHPNMNTVPGIDMSTGSLGQGISTACGMALGAKLRGTDERVYTLLGDGEIQEGQVWEATDVCRPPQAGQSGRHYRQQRPADRRPRGRGHEPLSHPREAACLRL